MYTIQNYIPNRDTKKGESHGSCLLKNGYELVRSPRSDEKICIKEKDLFAIIRTVLFLRVFDIGPSQSLNEIVSSGLVSFNEDKVHLRVINLEEAVSLLDDIFGTGFSSTVSKTLSRWFYEYKTSWSYYPFVRDVKLPSATDILKLYEFINMIQGQHTQTVRFLRSNVMDNNMPMQKTKVYLK